MQRASRENARCFGAMLGLISVIVVLLDRS